MAIVISCVKHSETNGAKIWTSREPLNTSSCFLTTTTSTTQLCDNDSKHFGGSLKQWCWRGNRVRYVPEWRKTWWRGFISQSLLLSQTRLLLLMVWFCGTTVRWLFERLPPIISWSTSAAAAVVGTGAQTLGRINIVKNRVEALWARL